ncbi:hypothetical protein [Bathycoccus sp. RCC716 virus 1]|uniref:Uncharacterized protein n=1 Tax=Bathycoccus sp. RCC716 virus 1 TaxID=2530038 RepID=A0A7S6SW30_9PHYC|nr:hypothetical protein [Bathycoccus sp. RCC716 virus 1]
MVSLQDLPKKVQYIMIDSQFVNGNNNTFSVNLSLESNLHVEEISQVVGIKPVDFYATQVGANNAGDTNVAKYIDIVCDDIPRSGQLLNERNGQILARIPLERSFTGSNSFILRDKQWRSFHRKTNLFNPISIQKLNFRLYESQGDNDYKLMQPDSEWYMTLEVTTIDVKEKPTDRELQILEALHKLIGKIDELNINVEKLPDKHDIEKMENEKRKKYPFRYLMLFITLIVGGFVFVKSKFTPSVPQPSF